MRKALGVDLMEKNNLTEENNRRDLAWQ